jgi:hypothetical protein
MDRVAIARRVEDGEVDMLRARTKDTDQTALLAFYDAEIATEHLSGSEELEGEDWVAIEVDLLALAAICATFGVGYIALPTEFGLGGAAVGSALDMLEVLSSR